MTNTTISKQMSYGFAATISVIIVTAVISLFIVAKVGSSLVELNTKTLPRLVLLADIRDAVRANGKRLHFAGEHLAQSASGMEAALESGDRAAKTIIGRV